MRLFILFSALHCLDAGVAVILKAPVSSPNSRECSLILYYPRFFWTHNRAFEVEPCIDYHSERKYHKSDLPADLKMFTVTGKAETDVRVKKTLRCSFYKQTMPKRFVFARFTGSFPYTPALTRKGKRNQICRLIAHKYVAVMESLLKTPTMQSSDPSLIKTTPTIQSSEPPLTPPSPSECKVCEIRFCSPTEKTKKCLMDCEKCRYGGDVDVRN